MLSSLLSSVAVFSHCSEPSRLRISAVAVRPVAVAGAVVHHFHAVGRRGSTGCAAARRPSSRRSRRRWARSSSRRSARPAGPAGVAHPDQQAHAVLALRLEHGAIAFVVDELRERHPIGGVIRAAVAVLDAVAEGRAALRAGQREIVHAPHRRPAATIGFLGHHLLQAVDGDDVGHAQFAVQLGGGALRK